MKGLFICIWYFIMKILIITIALVASAVGLLPVQDDHNYKENYLLELDEEEYKENMEAQYLLSFVENEYKENIVKTVDHLNQIKGFNKFMMQFNKTYNNYNEYNKRHSIFRDNMKKVFVLQQTEKGSALYGPTKHSDLTEEEFSQLLGLRIDMKPVYTSMRPADILDDFNLPEEFDWRTKGAVTPVKDQGKCGSCWAFSTTGNIEGQYAIKHNKLISFSEQELIDCDLSDRGCTGGLPETAYNSIRMLGGLEVESDYPYYGYERKCHFNKAMAKVTVIGAYELSRNEDDIAKFLVKYGPVSAAVNATPLKYYRGGVLLPSNRICNPRGLNHAVLIVGYGVDRTYRRPQPYWIIKNTWGSDFGEEGYFRLHRGDGTCGINLVPTSAIID